MPTSAFDVGAPQPVRGVRDEPALDQVIVDGRGALASAGLARSADALHPSASHQPRDALAPDPDVLGEPELAVNARGTVTAAAHHVDVDDGVREVGILEVTRRQRPTAPLVVARL